MSWPEATSTSVHSRRPCGMEGVEHSACQSAMHPQPSKGGVFWRRKISAEYGLTLSAREEGLGMSDQLSDQINYRRHGLVDASSISLASTDFGIRDAANMADAAFEGRM